MHSKEHSSEQQGESSSQEARIVLRGCGGGGRGGPRTCIALALAGPSGKEWYSGGGLDGRRRLRGLLHAQCLGNHDEGDAARCVVDAADDRGEDPEDCAGDDRLEDLRRKEAAAAAAAATAHRAGAGKVGFVGFWVHGWREQRRAAGRCTARPTPAGRPRRRHTAAPGMLWRSQEAAPGGGAAAPHPARTMSMPLRVW